MCITQSNKTFHNPLLSALNEILYVVITDEVTSMICLLNKTRNSILNNTDCRRMYPQILKKITFPLKVMKINILE